MARNNLSRQETRTAKNPFSLGAFESLSLRYLTGNLGPKNQVISGGYGNGEYNHWYSITLNKPGWIITIKGGSRPKAVSLSTYDLNRVPIEGRSIFDADSISINSGVEKYYPYLDTVMSAQSDLYNTYERIRLDKGDERYYPLEKGTYLLCVSAVRNEGVDYGVGIVVEFPITKVLMALEDSDGSTFLTENGDQIICEPGNDLYFETIHDHSLREWQATWNNEHKSDNEPFPAEFVPYANRP
jgi:hypothetical protein